jgi:hypothetical protein
MTEPTRLETTECLHCGVEFVPRKAGHVFHSIECRHRGARRPEDRVPVDHEAVERLFDPRRDPSERVRRDDWHPDPNSGFFELELFDTVESRRRWYRNLRIANR